MVNKVLSGGVRGIEAFPVYVETDISNGMPMFELVGYLGSEVREARERVRTALKNNGYTLPVAHITVNLAPADQKKTGTGFDLPIAVSVLMCMNIIPGDLLENTFVAGELMLSGKITSTRGILPMILMAKALGAKRCVIPKENISEGAVVEGIDVYGVESIEEVVKFFNGECCPERITPILADELNKPLIYMNDFADVRGQVMAKRGAEIAAAGLHNIIMTGPPGSGKSMIAKCIPSILPPLCEEECLEVSAIYSVKGALSRENPLITVRPFVTAHHTSTDISLIGGGGIPRPGAVSLAHKGVLFLDEIPEFSRSALESLRQPLEDKEVNITRAKDICRFPSDFMLVAAMNPCPCGHYPDRNRCHCTDAMREKYIAKISGPLFDRIDICITTKKVSPVEIIQDFGVGSSNRGDWHENKKCADDEIEEKCADTERKSRCGEPETGKKYAVEREPSAAIRERVMAAHNIQRERYKGQGITFNSQMNNKMIEKYCRLDKTETDILTELAIKHDLSARSYFRILRVSRTIADLAGSDTIREEHLLEALRLKLNYK